MSKNVVKMKTGRPSKLQTEKAIRERICSYLERGMYHAEAAKLAGISERTFYNWMERGREEDKGPYHEFMQAVKKAESKAELDLLEVIQAASSKQWTAAAWILERRWPRRWGKTKAEKGERPDPTKAETQKMFEDIGLPSWE